MEPARNALAIRQSLATSRPLEGSSWTLPPWGHPLAAGIFPFCVRKHDRLRPIGTAFAFSRLGHLASAMHNVRDAWRDSYRGDALNALEELPESVHLTDISFAVLHQHVVEANTLQLNVWSLESCDGAPPSDLVFGWPRFQEHFPVMALPLSLAVPRIGEKLTCIGYGNMSFPKELISVEDIARGDVSWMQGTDLRLQATEGRVTEMFTHGLSKGFARGACVVLDCEVSPGQSGGPVVNEAGYVCGIVSATATNFFQRHTSVVGLLYPAYTSSLRMSASKGAVRIDSTQPLAALIAGGSVVTDGSEERLHQIWEDTRWGTHPAVHKDDAHAVYKDFAAYQARKPASPIEGEAYRLRPVKDPVSGG